MTTYAKPVLAADAVETMPVLPAAAALRCGPQRSEDTRSGAPPGAHRPVLKGGRSAFGVTVPGGLEVGPPKSRADLRMSIPAGSLPELRRHLDQFSGVGRSGLVFPYQQGQPLRRQLQQVSWLGRGPQPAGHPDLHPHVPGNTLAAQSGARLRDPMVRMGHDSPAAVLIYQHSSRAADEAIAAALDVQLEARLQADEIKSVAVLGPIWATDHGEPSQPEAG